MLVGYARTSTVDQHAGLQAQIRDLMDVGCERVFSEQISANATIRPKLEEALAFVRSGDVLITTRPDRLARNTSDLLKIVEDLTKREIALRILSMGNGDFDSRSSTAQLMLTVLAAVAHFEKSIMLERQLEGIKRAKAAGRYRGRAPTARKNKDAVLELRRSGVPVVEIASRLKISRASAYRFIKEAA